MTTTQLQQMAKTMFDSPTSPNCAIYHLFTHTVVSAIKMSGFSRPVIAERMNNALSMDAQNGIEPAVDEAKLNKWLAPSQPHHMPIHYLPALCWAVKSMEPANTLLGPLLFKAVDQRAQLLQQHAELQLEIEQRTAMQRSIADTLLTPSAATSQDPTHN